VTLALASALVVPAPLEAAVAGVALDWAPVVLVAACTVPAAAFDAPADELSDPAVEVGEPLAVVEAPVAAPVAELAAPVAGLSAPEEFGAEPVLGEVVVGWVVAFLTLPAPVAPAEPIPAVRASIVGAGASVAWVLEGAARPNAAAPRTTTPTRPPARGTTNFGTGTKWPPFLSGRAIRQGWTLPPNNSYLSRPAWIMNE
jgi:hypothetical protein